MKIHRLDHIHIYCSDADVSMRFYAQVFQAEVIGTAHGSDGGVRYFLRLGGLTLVLAPYPRGTEPGTPGTYRDGIYEHGYPLEADSSMSGSGTKRTSRSCC